MSSRSYRSNAHTDSSLAGLMGFIVVIVVFAAVAYGFMTYILPSLIETKQMFDGIVGMLPVVELARLFL